MARYRSYSSAAPTTASQAVQATGTAIKTMLQIAPPAGVNPRVWAWGISFDGSAAATPGIVELVETDVAATVTAHTAAGLVGIDDAAVRNGNSGMTLGTSATGYAASAEGTITATRVLDAQLIAPTNQYAWMWPDRLGPIFRASKFLRVRVKFGTTVNAIAWVEWDE